MEQVYGRLTIDNALEPVDFNNAITAFMTVVAQNPDQPVGNGGVIPHEIDDRVYNVVRNEDSYTVRCGAMPMEDDLTMEGFPI